MRERICLVALSQLAWAHAQETLLWAAKDKKFPLGVRHGQIGLLQARRPAGSTTVTRQ